MIFGKGNKVSQFVDNEKLETSRHFESDITVDNITNSVGGYGWTVTYFNQLLKSNDETNVLDINLTKPTQQYRKIENLEIKLISPLESLTASEIKGTAYVNIGSAINKNDMFVAELHDGRVCVFKVDDVVDTTYELNQIATIEFSYFTFASEDEALYKNLHDKVVTEYIYDNDFKQSNGSPIIAKKEYLSHYTVLANCQKLMTNYLSKFLRNGLLVLNIDEGDLIDPYLTDFILSTFSVSDIPKLSNVNRLNSNIVRNDTFTIYNCILGNLELSYANKLGFTRTVNDPNTYVYIRVPIMVGLDRDVIINDADYFISDAFYSLKTVDKVTSFEKILFNFINGDTNTVEEIDDCIKNTLSLSDFDVYFKIPILLMIYKNTSSYHKG